MARRTFLLSEVSLSEESSNLTVNGNLAVTGTSTFTGVSSFGDGTAAAPSITFTADTNTGLFRVNDEVLGFSASGGGIAEIATTGLFASSTSFIGFLSGALNTSADTILTRDAANVLALKNSTTAQTVRIYGTTTNSQYLQLTHNGTNGIITTSGGTFGFGTHTTSAGTNINGVTGYISIVDSGGTPRRLAVLT